MPPLAALVHMMQLHASGSTRALSTLIKATRYDSYCLIWASVWVLTSVTLYAWKTKQYSFHYMHGKLYGLFFPRYGTISSYS